jgi:hypothetical protein
MPSVYTRSICHTVSAVWFVREIVKWLSSSANHPKKKQSMPLDSGINHIKITNQNHHIPNGIGSSKMKLPNSLFITTNVL